MRRIYLPDPPPADCRAYRTLKFQATEHPTGAWTCKAWRGRQQKPYAHYSFRAAAAVEAWIQYECEAEDRRLGCLVERRLQHSRAVEAQRVALQVGTILHYAWGYEQTQCEFYEVVARTGYTATLREIGSIDVGPQGGMSTHYKPNPGHFVGPPICKRITAGGVTMPHGIATPCDRDAAQYCSWYG